MTTEPATSPDTDSADRTATPPHVPVPRAAREQEAPEKSPPVRRRLRLPRYTLSGTAAALVLAYSSFTPSLLPRGWLLQGLIAGITAAIGYGLGVTVTWFVKEFTDRRPSPPARRRAWRILAGTAVVLGLVMLWLGLRWQREIHELMGLEPPAAYKSGGIVLVALVLFVVLVGCGRGLRRLTRWLMRVLGRILPPRLVRPLAVVAVSAFMIFLLNGVLFQGLVEAANSTFSLADGTTEEGAVQPTAPERSGSPASLVAWDDLGKQGRNFVGMGPTPEELTAFSGEPSQEPVRVYAGLASGSDTEERAALAVRDLQRAGGFDRQVLVVVTTTGTGWVDPAASNSLEYVFNGDTAMVAMQYSYLPSWISFLVDQSKAREAGRTLFDKVYAAWAELPPDDRPELYVYGESLGSFGGEAAFSGLGDIENRTDGVLWAGPPNFNELWRGLVEDRDAGTPEWLPVYEGGRTVRFADDVPDLDRPAGPWGSPRLVYLQNASDPIVWWTPRLMLSQPDWLRDEQGPDVSQDMFWMPFVTFWQVSADMAFSTGVPGGHGHHYVADYVDGWARVAQPPGWSADDTERLRELIGGG